MRARTRLGVSAMQWLFEHSGQHWARRLVESDTFFGLKVYGALSREPQQQKSPRAEPGIFASAKANARPDARNVTTVSSSARCLPVEMRERRVRTLFAR